MPKGGCAQHTKQHHSRRPLQLLSKVFRKLRKVYHRGKKDNLSTSDSKKPSSKSSKESAESMIQVANIGVAPLAYSGRTESPSVPFETSEKERELSCSVSVQSILVASFTQSVSTQESLEQECNTTESSYPFPFNANDAVSAEEVELSNTQLGSGSEGQVMLAKYRGYNVAIKYGNNNERIMKEQQTLASFNHRNIVKTFGYFQLDSHSVALYELCDCGSLESFVSQTPTIVGTRTSTFVPNKLYYVNLTPSSALFDSILEGILRGLSYLHRIDWVHMDIKGDNVLLTSNLVPKLADFGYACKRSNYMPIRGTKAYMAPEVVLAWACDDGSVSRAFTGAVDIYSFGMMLLYFCNNDKHPYAAFNKFRKWWACVSKDVTKVTPEYFCVRDDVWTQISKVSMKYFHIVEQCLQFQPEDRPSADELIAMLHEDYP